MSLNIIGHVDTCDIKQMFINFIWWLTMRFFSFSCGSFYSTLVVIISGKSSMFYFFHLLKICPVFTACMYGSWCGLVCAVYLHSENGAKAEFQTIFVSSLQTVFLLLTDLCVLFLSNNWLFLPLLLFSCFLHGTGRTCCWLNRSVVLYIFFTDCLFAPLKTRRCFF